MSVTFLAQGNNVRLWWGFELTSGRSGIHILRASPLTTAPHHLFTNALIQMFLSLFHRTCYTFSSFRFLRPIINYLTTCHEIVALVNYHDRWTLAMARLEVRLQLIMTKSCVSHVCTLRLVQTFHHNSLLLQI